MAIYDLQVPLPDDSTDTFRMATSMEGQQFVLDFSWSARTESWYVDVYAVTSGPGLEQPVATGLRISVGWPVLAGVTGALRPPGEIIPVDMSGQGLDPAHDELGGRVLVLYYDASEFGRS